MHSKIAGLDSSEKATESKVTNLILRLEYTVAFYYSSSKEIHQFHDFLCFHKKTTSWTPVGREQT